MDKYVFVLLLGYDSDESNKYLAKSGRSRAGEIPDTPDTKVSNTYIMYYYIN